MYTDPNETSPANRNSLPAEWVNRIFEVMSGLYGTKFADLWKDSNKDFVLGLWAKKLAGFREMPGAIKEALDSLDSKPYPPTLPEFLAMCREAAPRHLKSPVMVGYTTTEEDRAKAQEIVLKAYERIVDESGDHKEWAKKLKTRHEAGENLSLVQVQAYQEALAENAA